MSPANISPTSTAVSGASTATTQGTDDEQWMMDFEQTGRLVTLKHEFLQEVAVPMEEFVGARLTLDLAIICSEREHGLWAMGSPSPSPPLVQLSRVGDLGLDHPQGASGKPVGKRRPPPRRAASPGPGSRWGTARRIGWAASQAAFSARRMVAAEAGAHLHGNGAAVLQVPGQGGPGGGLRCPSSRYGTHTRDGRKPDAKTMVYMTCAWPSREDAHGQALVQWWH